MINLVIITIETTDIGFYRGNRPTNAPHLSFPTLLEANPIRRVARASYLDGLNQTEVPNTSFELNNAAGQLSKLLNTRLLHDCYVEMYENDEVKFNGTISGFSLGSVATITVVSYSLTDLIPLRNTTEWGEYKESVPIPECYGDLTKYPVECIQMDQSGFEWCPSNGNIEVISVYVDDEEIDAWEYGPFIDPAGEVVTRIVLAGPIENGSVVTASVIGHKHPVTGIVLESPADVLWHLLTQVCKKSVSESDLEQLRTETKSADIRIANQIKNNLITIKEQIDEIAESIAMAWTWGMWKIYPPVVWPTVFRADLQPEDLLNVSDPEMEARSDDYATSVQINYGYRSGDNSYAHSILRQAYDSQLPRTDPHIINSKWIKDFWTADAMADRCCARLASLRVPASLSVTNNKINPGHWLKVNHPRVPTGVGEFFALGSFENTGENRLSGEIYYGSRPNSAIVNQGERLSTPESGGLELALRNSVLTIKVYDPDGRIAPGADVLLDNSIQRRTNSEGIVTFTNVSKGLHLIAWQIAGFEVIEMEVTI